jgi:hypothetical protein
MLKVTVRNNVRFPEITLQDDLEHIARDIIIPDIIIGIDTQRSIVGGQLPNNEPATIMRKAGQYVGRLYKKSGEKRKNFEKISERNMIPSGSGRPLVETGLLRSSFIYRMGKGVCIISINNSQKRKDIGGYLQDGIQTKHGLKRYRFFGISDRAFKMAMFYLKKKVKDSINAKRGA